MSMAERRIAEAEARTARALGVAAMYRGLTAVAVARLGGTLSVTPDEIERTAKGLLGVELARSPVGGVDLTVLEYVETPVAVEGVSEVEL